MITNEYSHPYHFSQRFKAEKLSLFVHQSDRFKDKTMNFFILVMSSGLLMYIENNPVLFLKWPVVNKYCPNIFTVFDK